MSDTASVVSDPPSYKSDDAIPEPAPAYTVDDAPPMYKLWNTMVSLRAYRQQEDEQEDEDTPVRVACRWIIVIIIVAAYILSLGLPFLVLFSTPISTIEDSYLFELDNTHANLSAFASPDRLNLTLIEQDANELISLPDFLRISTRLYCTDDDPLFRDAKCHQYHDYNGQGSLLNIYAVLVFAATGKRVDSDTVILPDSDSLQLVPDMRVNLKYILSLCIASRGLGIPILFYAAIECLRTNSSLPEMNVKVFVCLVSLFSGLALPFSLAASSLVMGMNDIVCRAFTEAFDEFGVTVNKGGWMMAYCWMGAAIDFGICTAAGIAISLSYWSRKKNQAPRVCPYV